MANKRSGEEQGRPGKKSEKLWRDALMLAVNRLSKDGKTKNLNILAMRLVHKAAEGDVRALQEIGDRIDGKPSQAVQLDATEGLEGLLDRIRGTSPSEAG